MATVDIRPLKQFAASKLPSDHSLRTVLLVEEDTLPAEEFLAKVKMWVKLANVTV